VSDPANPENEGKVFLYQYGKKIHDKIKDTMHPEFDDETPVNPFDLWEGADFKLRARQVAGFRNYDKSEFASPSALLDDDGELEQIWKKEYSLEALVAPDQFKEYAELKSRFERVIGNSAPSNEVEEREYVQPAPSRAVEAAPALETSDNNGDDDNLSYFSKLAEDV